MRKAIFRALAGSRRKNKKKWGGPLESRGGGKNWQQAEPYTRSEKPDKKDSAD